MGFFGFKKKNLHHFDEGCTNLGRFNETGTRKVIDRNLDEMRARQVFNGYICNRTKVVDSYSVIFLALHTGMRKGELLALRWKDVDFQKRTITVARSMGRTVGKGIVFKEPKTKHSRRTILMMSTVIEILKKVKNRQAEQKLSLGEAYDDQDLIFTQADGSPVEPYYLGKFFRRAVARTTLPSTL